MAMMQFFQQDPNQFGLSLAQKAIYTMMLITLSLLVIPLNPLFAGAFGTIFFVLYGLLLGVAAWYTSAGWSFKLTLTPTEIKVRDGHRENVLPLDKVGMLVKGGKIPFMPSVWVILRGASVGKELPAKGIDPRALELIESYQKRNPGKKLTYLPLPGGYLRSIPGLVAELKQRIPPLTVDDRLGGK